MKRMMRMGMSFLTVLLLCLVTACGGGGGGSEPIAQDPVVGPTQAQAVVSMSLAGGNETVDAVEVEIELPAGFALQTDAEGDLADGVLTTSVPGVLIMANYVPEDNFGYGRLNFALVSDGVSFAPGEISTLIQGLAQGQALPAADEFTVVALTVTKLTDKDTVELTGYTLTSTVESREVPL